MFGLTPVLKGRNGSGTLMRNEHPLDLFRRDMDTLFDRFFAVVDCCTIRAYRRPRILSNSYLPGAAPEGCSSHRSKSLTSPAPGRTYLRMPGSTSSSVSSCNRNFVSEGACL